MKPGSRERRPMAIPPRFSVVVPVIHDRETGEACVKSWLKQSIPGEDYEIVLVSPSPTGRWERKLGALLRPQDRILGPVAGGETALWDHGARQARGDWLLLTEAHCVAHRRCLEEMGRYLGENDVVGACCRTRGIVKTPIARMDEHFCRLGFNQAIQPEDWHKLSMHGSAIARRVYLELDGF